jgi:Ribonuclease G/E
VRAALGEGAPVQLHTGGDLFVDFGVDDAIARALAPDVPLPCGGALRIETTAGATVIDVDAGPADPAVANAEAMTAAARALRLRNIGGHILIDVIPPTGKRTVIRAAGTVLAERLAALAAHDPAGVAIAGVTPLGMIELTRRRVGLSLWETLEQGERRDATLAYTALRRAVRVAYQAKATRVAVAAEAGVIALLQGGVRAAVREAQEMAHVEIILRPRAAGIDVAVG